MRDPRGTRHQVLRRSVVARAGSEELPEEDSLGTTVVALAVVDYGYGPTTTSRVLTFNPSNTRTT
jgi:hypothetical protein